MEAPLLSVIMITYGHEKYISEAIKGVFMQKTNFPIELIIANDCSPDETDTIVRKLIPEAPNNIVVKYTRHSQNIGMIENHYWGLKQAQGKYIAICEGDDYWSAPNKLQKQIDFLEQNKDYCICCHNVFFLKETELITPTIFSKNFGENTLIELSKENFIPTLSAVFRNIKLDTPKWLYSAPFGDYPLWLLLSKYGKIMFLEDIMGVYRQNVGIWSGKKRNHLGVISFLSNFIRAYENFPAVKHNLTKQKNRYIKLMLSSLSIKDTLKNSYFKELPLKDKTIVLSKKLK